MTARNLHGNEPKGYRFLFVTYPRAWREVHADVVLGTLLMVHAEAGRTRARLGERIGFAVDGLRYWVRTRFSGRPARRFADLAALHDFHAFDQGNGRTAGERVVSEIEQIRANSAVDRDNDGDRAAALAWSAMNMQR